MMQAVDGRSNLCLLRLVLLSCFVLLQSAVCLVKLALEGCFATRGDG